MRFYHEQRTSSLSIFKDYCFKQWLYVTGHSINSIMWHFDIFLCEAFLNKRFQDEWLCIDFWSRRLRNRKTKLRNDLGIMMIVSAWHWTVEQVQIAGSSWIYLSPHCCMTNALIVCIKDHYQATKINIAWEFSSLHEIRRVIMLQLPIVYD